MASTPLARLDVGEDEGAVAAHLAGVAVHHLQAGADHRSEVGLVDHQQVRPGDARPALARDLVAGRHVDDVDGEVRQLRREGRREVVATRFDEDQVEVGELRVHLVDGGEVDRGVLADRGVRTAAGLDAEHDAFRLQRAGAGKEFRVLLGVDVVGDRRDFPIVAHALAQRVGQRGLAGPDGAADADAERAGVALFDSGESAHERNSLVYWVSWIIEVQSTAIARPPRSSSGAASAVSRRPVGDGVERRQRPLAVGLAERHQPHPGGNQVGGEGRAGRRSAPGLHRPRSGPTPAPPPPHRPVAGRWRR